MTAPVIRAATADAADAIAAIYAHHVRYGTATFDTVAPSVADMRDKIAQCTERGWPLVVAEVSEKIVGYAYATQFRDRPAYAFTCENSIYIHADHQGQGVGKVLLAALLVEAKRAGFRQMIAVIGGGEPASIALHARLGFRHAGQMRSVGRKAGRWLDTIYMQIAIGAGDNDAPSKEPL